MSARQFLILLDPRGLLIKGRDHKDPGSWVQIEDLTEGEAVRVAADLGFSFLESWQARQAEVAP